MNDTTKNAVMSLEEYKNSLLRSIAIAIQATNCEDKYSVGLRNGLRVCKAYIDGLEPEYEECKPPAEPCEDAVKEYCKKCHYSIVTKNMMERFRRRYEECKPVEYADCANAMMKMWIDNIVTDGEYSRIMDKLNAHEIARRGVKHGSGN